MNYPNVVVTASGGPLDSDSTKRVQVAHGVEGENFHWDEMRYSGGEWIANVTPRSTRGRDFRYDIYYFDRNGEQIFLDSEYKFIPKH